MKLNTINLNHLNLFSVVADCQSVTKAAVQLSLTRSAVSQGLSKLEASLGVPLFRRVGKKLLITSQGRKLHLSVNEMRARLQETLADVSEQSNTLSGTIRLGFFLGFSKTRLSQFMADFLERNPLVKARIFFDAQTGLLEALLEDRIDVALSLYPLEKEDRRVVSRKLFREELVLVAPRQLYKTNFTISEIQQLPVVEYYQNSFLFRNWVRHHFKKEISKINVRAYAASTDFVLDFILKGIGVGIVPKSVAAGEIKRGKLFQISTQQEEMTDYTWLNVLWAGGDGFMRRAFVDSLLKSARL